MIFAKRMIKKLKQWIVKNNILLIFGIITILTQ